MLQGKWHDLLENMFTLTFRRKSKLLMNNKVLRLFPDTDPGFKGADSRVLLRHVYNIVQKEGYFLVNTDITIIAQAPKMAPHIPKMCENIAADLHVEIDQVNVKATTTEITSPSGLNRCTS